MTPEMQADAIEQYTDPNEAANLRKQLDEARAAVREAFVDGAKWWEFYSMKGTMWPSDQREVENVAEQRYPHAPWAHKRAVEQWQAEAEINRAAWLKVREERDAALTVLRRIQATTQLTNANFDAIEALLAAHPGASQ